MLYILTALKCEAAALGGLPGEVIVTGAGGRVVDRIKQLDLKPDDCVLNVGICAGTEKGEGYLINQVISSATGRRFYPDILFESGAKEMTVTYSDEVVISVGEGMLYDMESALICDAVLKMIPPSNLALYKVVSDSGENFPSANEVTQLIRAHLDEIRKIASLLVGEEVNASYEFIPESIKEKLRLTQYMRNELKDLEHYCVASGRQDELLKLLSDMENDGRIPVKDKKAGREVLDEIYSYLR
ncbi:MAG: hypothetical protein IIX95_07375 [Clostridiales bacterium]|nr:hypothetical protein [Clostridiales bacterium]